LVVLAPLFSVGTVRLYSWSCPDNDTAGLTRACAEADAAAISEPTATIDTPSSARCIKYLLI
jgi:hypothetical protein